MTDPYELALQRATERHDAELIEPDDEPMSLPDLRDLIRETADALDTLCEHVVLIRHGADDEHTRGELAALEDKLRQAWVQTMRALADAAELAHR